MPNAIKIYSRLNEYVTHKKVDNVHKYVLVNIISYI